jgi:chromosome segregation ATPase
MKRLKKTLVSALVLCSLLSAAGYYTGHCSAAEYVMTEEQLNILEQELKTLSENNRMQLSLLEESEADLQTANTELTALKDELKAATAELQRLRFLLSQLKAESASAETSLRIANEELKNASESLKKSEDRTRRIERQRNFWEIIAGALAVFTAVK